MSATSANNYLASIVDDYPVVPSTVALLFAFAVLSFIGITESAFVAVLIFIVHVGTLIVLILVSAFHAITHPDILLSNLQEPWPDIDLAGMLQPGRDKQHFLSIETERRGTDRKQRSWC